MDLSEPSSDSNATIRVGLKHERLTTHDALLWVLLPPTKSSWAGYSYTSTKLGGRNFICCFGAVTQLQRDVIYSSKKGEKQWVGSFVTSPVTPSHELMSEHWQQCMKLCVRKGKYSCEIHLMKIPHKHEKVKWKWIKMRMNENLARAKLEISTSQWGLQRIQISFVLLARRDSSSIALDLWGCWLRLTYGTTEKLFPVDLHF